MDAELPLGKKRIPTLINIFHSVSIMSSFPKLQFLCPLCAV